MKFWAASLILISEFAFAQLDPSSGLLLNSDSKPSRLENGLDSGRYTVRKKITLTKQTPAKTTEVEEDEVSAPVPVAAPVAASVPVAVPVPVPVPVTASATVPPVAPMAAASSPPIQEQKLVQPSTKPPEMNAIPETPVVFSPIDEKKNNIMEISVAPVFIYNHSSADISTRNYSTSGPAYLLEVGAWIHPSFALHAQLINSLASSVNDSYDKTRNANLSQQWISGGFRYRNFLSSQRNAASVTVGADYEDYQFQVGSDSQIRNSLETSGFNLSLSSEIPQSSRYSWELGIEFMPKAKHIETLTSANVQSGNSPDADMIGVSFGGRIYIDSANQMFWKVSERIEKDQFAGDSSKPDPATNSTQTNVNVTNTFTMIQIGYTWGN